MGDFADFLATLHSSPGATQHTVSVDDPAMDALRVLLDLFEDVRAGRMGPNDPRVTDAMVDAKITLGDI